MERAESPQTTQPLLDIYLGLSFFIYMTVLDSQPSAKALFHRPCPKTCPLSLAKQGAPLHHPTEVRMYISAPGLFCLLVVPPPLLGPVSRGPRGSLTPISQDRLTPRKREGYAQDHTALTFH